MPDQPIPEQPIRRRGLARTLVVLAAVLAFVGMFSVWINRQILNTDNWTATSSELLESPTIRNQVAGFLVDELYANVDVAAEIRAALPERAQPLAGPAAGALRSLAERATREILSRPRAQAAWENANREAHKLFLKVLEGGGPIVATTGGNVVLDLKELLLETEERIGIGGRVANALPEDAAEITVLKSDQLDLAQDVFNTLRPLPIVLVGLSLLLFGGALLASPGWRRQTVRAYGIGLIAAGALGLAALALLGDTVTASLARTEAGEPAVRQTWTIGTTLLDEVAVSTIGYGVLLLLGAVLAGPTRAATAVRRFLAPYLREPTIAYGGLAVLLAVGILWWAPTPATRNPATAILLAVLIAFGFEALRRRTRREFPDADLDTAREHWHHAGTTVKGWVGSARSSRKTSSAPTASGGNGGSRPEVDERLAKLEQLERLRVSGTVDDAEFKAEKARILSGAPS